MDPLILSQTHTTPRYLLNSALHHLFSIGIFPHISFSFCFLPYIQIPQLQTFVSFAAVRRRYEAICKYTESVKHFLNNIKHFLSDDGTASADLRCVAVVENWERAVCDVLLQVRATWLNTNKSFVVL
jgi:hypothetical protein